ncbi:hypothetical protein DYB26_007298 [Aphanomyces astaci]|uniref:Uncharacterized protein n=3 Tax=Aphanomyces astaci TaxID=112090 RepID=A0A3R6Z442_APHAT|nr:hypothetical protein DYB26_007298 [Aphanomyces astaci]
MRNDIPSTKHYLSEVYVVSSLTGASPKLRASSNAPARPLRTYGTVAASRFAMAVRPLMFTELGNTNRMRVLTDEEIEHAVKLVPLHARQTMQTLAAQSGVKKTTIIRHMQRAKTLMSKTSHSKPYLTDANALGRITELNRLLFSTSDSAKRKSLEQQIEELEEEGIALRKKCHDEKELMPADAEVPIAHLTAELARRHFTNTIHLDNDAIRDILTSSHNERFPATAVIDSGVKTYWMSSGMYPQVLRLMLRQTVYIASVEITCVFVKELVIHCTHSRSVVNPEPIRVTLPPPPLSSMSSSPDARGDAVEAIDVRILSGYFDFCIVHGIKVKVDEDLETQQQPTKSVSQSSSSNTHIELGQLFLEDTVPKNIATSLKSRKFLRFFFGQLRPNPHHANTQSLFHDYPYISPCGSEMNYIKAADTPVVFTELKQPDCDDGTWTLVTNTGHEVEFHPSNVAMSPATNRLYHWIQTKHLSLFGLLKSHVAVEVSQFIDFHDDGHHVLTWHDQAYPLSQDTTHPPPSARPS